MISKVKTNTNGLFLRSKLDNIYFYDNASGHIFYVKDPSKVQSFSIYSDLIRKNLVKKAKIEEEDIRSQLFDLAIGFKQMILEITSGCNLRCKYCVYSDHYKFTRSHSETNMTFDTAKKAIDYYFKNFEIVYNRNANKKPIISFYGGEPLINFSLIKKVIRYVKSNYQKFEVDFHITTNGVLFTEEVGDFLSKNKFHILLSLDGYEENHNRNRVTFGGKNTFEIVMKNLNEFKKKHKDTCIFVAACYDFKTDLKKMLDFFDKNQIELLQANQVDESSRTYYRSFSKKDINEFFKNLEDIKHDFFDKVIDRKSDKSSSLFRFFNPIYAAAAYHPMLGESNSYVKPWTGACIPGEKLYITTQGKIKTCEKVGESCIVGDVFSGLDFKKIANMMTVYNNFVCENCENCNISRLCAMCFKDFQSKNGFFSDKDLCKRQKIAKKSSLQEYVNLLEKKPSLFEEITTDYYNQLESGGGIF